MVNSHRKGNQIHKIKINEVWVYEEAVIRLGTVEAFKALLSDTEEWRVSLDGLPFPRISEEEAPRHELTFIVNEVFAALSDLNGDKALSPDGYTIAFWQFNWNIVRDDIMRMFKDFHETSHFVKNLNTIFLVMVPKKTGLRTLRTIDPLAWWAVCTSF